MTEQTRVLLIEDNPGDARLVETALLEAPEARFRIERVERLSAAVRRLAEGGLDVVLLDLGLPDAQGLEAVEALRESSPKIPIVVLSGASDEELAMQAVQCSAQDFLVKTHVDHHSLTRSLRYAIERNRNEEALRESEDRLRLAMAAAHEVIWEYDLTSGAIRCNENRDDGRPDDLDSVTAAMGGRIHEQDRERVGRSLLEALTGADSCWEAEYRIYCSDGACANIYNRAVINRNERGEPTRVVGAMLDVSRRMQAEDALRDANRQLRQLSLDLLRSQDQERRRIGRELHDGTAQLMASISLTLSRSLNSSLPVERQRDLVQEALAQVRECSREIRTLSYLLHPPLLDEVGLISAVQHYAEGFAQRTGIDVSLRIIENFGRLPSEVEVTLFRIIQEGLANVHKHSGSSGASIELDRQPREVRLTLEDHGRGLQFDDNLDKGFVRFGVGIPGMRERAEQLGGTLELVSGNRGTKLTVVLPLPKRHEETQNLSC